MDKVQRIKRYLQESKKEAPKIIPMDLSQIVDANHARNFATKHEVVKEFERVFSVYDNKFATLKGEIGLSESQIANRIESINSQLVESINRITRKLGLDKIELSKEFENRLSASVNLLNSKIELTNEFVNTELFNYKSSQLKTEDLLSVLKNTVSSIKIPKQVTLKAGKNISIDKKEGKESIEYTIVSNVKPSLSVLQQMRTGVQQIVAGSNISITPPDGKGTVTINSTASGASVSGSTFYAGTGIDITGSTITNILPGVSLQAGNNITIQGLTISAIVSGSTIYAGTGIDITGQTVTNILPGVSMKSGTGINITGLTITNTLGFVGTGGVSVSLTGNTYTIFGLSSAINTNQVSEGTSNFYYKPTYFVGTGGASVSVTGKTLSIYAQSSGSPAWGDITGTLSAQTDLYAELVTKLSGTSTTNLLNEGTSNFYYKPTYFLGTGGVSVSVSGKTVTIYGLSTALNTNQITEGVSNFYYTETRFNSSLATKTTDNLSQGNSNFYYNPLNYLGTGGVSVSVNGKTLTFYGASTKVNTNETTEGNSGLYYSAARFSTDFANKTTNDLTEGTSNFYFKPTYAVGTGGVSVSVSGKTLTIFGLSTALNTNNAIEGGSGLFYSTQRFSTDFANKTTNDLAEGTSNFYYKPSYFVGTGGVSVSISGKTVTIFGLSSALNTNQISEGTSNFYWDVAHVNAGTGISLFKSGVSIQIGLIVSGISAQYLNGNGTYIAPLQSKSFYLEGATSTDFIPFYRVEQSMALVKTTYDISGGTRWVGQVQRWNNAQGASKYDTQSADTGVTTVASVTSYTGASYLSGEYMAIKGASVAGGVSWLLINVYFREN